MSAAAPSTSCAIDGGASESYDLGPFASSPVTIFSRGDGFSYHVSLCGDVAPAHTPNPGACSDASAAFQYNGEVNDCVAVGGPFSEGALTIVKVRLPHPIRSPFPITLLLFS
jgi:hypothetical protein